MRQCAVLLKDKIIVTHDVFYSRFVDTGCSSNTVHLILLKDRRRTTPIYAMVTSIMTDLVNL